MVEKAASPITRERTKETLHEGGVCDGRVDVGIAACPFRRHIHRQRGEVILHRANSAGREGIFQQRVQC